MSQSIRQSVSQSSYRTIGSSVSQFVSKSVGRSVSQTVESYSELDHCIRYRSTGKTEYTADRAELPSRLIWSDGLVSISFCSSEVEIN